MLKQSWKKFGTTPTTSKGLRCSRKTIPRWANCLSRKKNICESSCSRGTTMRSSCWSHPRQICVLWKSPMGSSCSMPGKLSKLASTKITNPARYYFRTAMFFNVWSSRRNTRRRITCVLKSSKWRLLSSKNIWMWGKPRFPRRWKRY